MDLNAIAIFVKVVEAGSFVGAAKLIDVPKSTISRRVTELEETLGVRLWQRGTRQSQLTELGRAYYERCRQIVLEIEEAAASVSQHQREPRGRLRLTTSVLMAESFLGEWCVEYMRKFPKTELDVYATARKVDLLADGFDLAIRVGPLEDSAHIVRKLAVAPQYICASPGYLTARGTPETTDDLRDHECVIFSPDRATPPWELENDSGDGLSVVVSGRYKINSLPAAFDACVSGFGLAALPALLCCDALRDGSLVRVLPAWSNKSRTVHALYPSRQHLSALVRTFLDFVTDKLKPPPWIHVAPGSR